MKYIMHRGTHPGRLRLVAAAIVCVSLLACAPATPPAAAPAAAPAATRGPAAAAQPDQAKMKAHFEGKTIELYIGYAPGGGYDLKGRIFAEIAPKYIPGNPKISVVNLAGGGGLAATRQVMRARPDGLSLVVIPAGIFVNELLGDDQDGFELSQPRKLGNYEVEADSYLTLFARTNVATSWDQIVAAGKQGKRFKQGVPAVGNANALAGEWLSMVGAPVDIVYGYGGSNEVLAALDRGEIDLFSGDEFAATEEASFTGVRRAFPNWLTSSPKFVTPVLSVRSTPPQTWFEPFGFTAPPNILDVVEATPLQKDAFRVAVQLREAMDPLSLPPGTPEDVYQTLRQALKATAEAPEFKAAMTQRGFSPGYRSPEDQDAGLGAVQKAPKEAVDIVRRMYTGK
jgi:tripartite-type tricarboxylate transporter receptor subunit TctC